MNNSENKHPGNSLYVLGSLYPYVTGGMEIFNYYFLKAQFARGKENIYYLSQQEFKGKGGKFIHLTGLKPQRLFYPLHFFYIIWTLRKTIDYVYISYAEQSGIIPFAQALILKLFRKPYVVTIHWGQEPEWRFKFPFVYFFRNAHTVIGVSEPICAAYKKVLPGKDFIFIPPLIPFETAGETKNALREKHGFTAGDKIFLYVGSLKAMKNPDTILNAVKEMGSEYLCEHGVKMIFAGSGDMGNSLKQDVAESGMEKVFHFAGLVNREKIPEYFKMADYYIISSDYEGTSVSLLEAMYNKLPIIASNAPGINRMVSDKQTALLFETKNVSRLKAAMQSMLEDKVLADSLASNAYKDYEEKYSYEAMISSYDKIFSSFG